MEGGEFDGMKMEQELWPNSYNEADVKFRTIKANFSVSMKTVEDYKTRMHIL
jgi:3-deoxy-D-manno-octulosonic-acid transferase